MTLWQRLDEQVADLKSQVRDLQSPYQIIISTFIFRLGEAGAEGVDMWRRKAFQAAKIYYDIIYYLLKTINCIFNTQCY